MSAVSDQVDDKTAQILRLRDMVRQDPDKAWEQAWQDYLTPWDDGASSQLALVDLLSAPPEDIGDLPRKGRALVPGCGRGYDVLELAKLGDELEVWGADLSETAVEKAKEFVASQSHPPVNVSFHALDFFKFPLPADGERFQIVYDYTFFCALPSARRRDWANRMSELLSPGSGLLITLQYPIDGDRPGGPPYSVDPVEYDSLLLPTFDKLHSRVPAKSLPSHVRRELIVVYRRKKVEEK